MISSSTRLSSVTGVILTLPAFCEDPALAHDSAKSTVLTEHPTGFLTAHSHMHTQVGVAGVPGPPCSCLQARGTSVSLQKQMVALYFSSTHNYKAADRTERQRD